MSIDIVIVNWNAGKLLKECVDSVIKYRDSSVCNILVIDNDSSDGSEMFLDDQLLVKLIRARKNLGFGKACNLGASHCNSEFILFLNPDARIFGDTLSKAQSFMVDNENTKIGICGVKLLDENGHIARSCSRAPSAKAYFSKAIGLTKIFPSLGNAMSEWNHLDTRIVDQVIGAFFFVRRTLFLSLQGFDERFFVYFEEVDFSYRARKEGWCSAYFCGAEAFHKGGGSSDQVKATRLFYSMRSRIQYVFKHFNVPSVVLVLCITLLVEPVSRSVFALLKGSIVSFKENLLAYRMLYGWLFGYKYGDIK
jgi:hypothetical protein